MGRNIAIFFCLQWGSIVSWVCCVDSWRFFFSVFEVFVRVLCIYFFFNSKDSYVCCYVLEIQESKASLLLNFVSPRVGLRLVRQELVWHELALVSCALLQRTGMVQNEEGCASRCLPAVNMFLHICGKKETPTWNKFPGKNSVLVPRVMAWLFSSPLAVSA